MESIIGWLLITAGGCLLLLATIITYIFRFMNIQKYKPKIEAIITKETNRPFVIKGDIKLSLFPWAGVSFSNLHLSNTEEFEKKDMLVVKRCEIHFKLRSLLYRRIEIDSFILDTPILFLEKRKDGITNWKTSNTEGQSTDDLANKKHNVPSKKKENIHSEKHNKTIGSNNKKVPVELIPIDKFSIKNGLVLYVDNTTSYKMEISDLNLTFFDLSLDKIIGLKLYEKIDDNQPAQLKTENKLFQTMVLKGNVKIINLHIGDIYIQDCITCVTGSNGVVYFDPFILNLYQGRVSAVINFNIKKNQPEIGITLDVKDLQAGQFLKNISHKETIEGTVNADISLTMSGKNLVTMKKNLEGKGNLIFLDGTIVGIDFANMVKNVTSNLGLTEKNKENPLTNFSEMKIPFSINKSIIDISDASLISPHIRLALNGDVNLVNNKLAFKIEPTFVATLSALGDIGEMSGNIVPILITGSFASLKIIPDLKSIIDSGVSEVEEIAELLNIDKLPEKRFSELESGVVKGVSWSEIINEVTGQNA